MARCPFAVWTPISGSVGAHVGGPYKIVHHTTEGSTAAGALGAFRANRSDPHFTVDATRIYQHIDTAEGARALRNEPGGVQTNRDSAVQIELVGFAHLPKNRQALTHLARLCRWIEATHGVPRVWPAGAPKPARNGRDPGGHRRDAPLWDRQSGHYGHCHVPENTHWDPGYSAAELDFLMQATFDAGGRLIGPPPPPLPAAALRRGASGAPAAPPRSTMPDHSDVGEHDHPAADHAIAPMAAAASRTTTTRARRPTAAAAKPARASTAGAAPAPARGTTARKTTARAPTGDKAPAAVKKPLARQTPTPKAAVGRKASSASTASTARKTTPAGPAKAPRRPRT